MCSTYKIQFGDDQLLPLELSSVCELIVLVPTFVIAIFTVRHKYKCIMATYDNIILTLVCKSTGIIIRLASSPSTIASEFMHHNNCKEEIGNTATDYRFLGLEHNAVPGLTLNTKHHEFRIKYIPNMQVNRVQRKPGTSWELSLS